MTTAHTETGHANTSHAPEGPPPLYKKDLTPPEFKTRELRELSQTFTRDLRAVIAQYALIPDSPTDPDNPFMTSTVSGISPLTDLRTGVETINKFLVALEPSYAHTVLKKEQLDHITDRDELLTHLHATSSVLLERLKYADNQDAFNKKTVWVENIRTGKKEKVSQGQVLLMADLHLAWQTGRLLKHMDGLRARGVAVERARELNDVWGDQGQSPQQTQQSLIPDAATNKWFYLRSAIPLERLPRGYTELLGRYFHLSHAENQAVYTAYQNKLSEVKIGSGSSLRTDLAHQVTNLLESRIRPLVGKDNPDYPPLSHVVNQRPDIVLALYKNTADNLLFWYQYPKNAWTEFPDPWHPGKVLTGTQILLNAARHEHQHSGSLGMLQVEAQNPISPPSPQTHSNP